MALSQESSPSVKTALPRDESYRFFGLSDIDFGLEAKDVKLSDTKRLALLKVLQKSEEGFLLRTSHEKNPVFQTNGDSPVRLETRKSSVPHDILKDDFILKQFAHVQDDVLTLVIPKGVKVRAPLRTSFWVQELNRKVFSRLAVVLEENAELTVDDEIFSSEDFESPTLLVLFKEWTLAKGAQLKLSQSFNQGFQVNAFIRQSFHLAENADVQYTPLFIGGCKTQMRSEIMLQGKNAHFNVLGGVWGQLKQVFDFWITVHHLAGNSKSELDFFSVMHAQSKAIFNGKVNINIHGKGSEAYQRNKNLLLSEDSEVVTLPKLEIAVDDVKCAHGASVASVNPDQLYYLQCRGIPQHEAEEMIVRGFIEPVLQRIKLSQVMGRAALMMERNGEPLL